MTKEFYRFRPIHRLIGEKGELNNQEIYFAHPSQLNDPMEGYRNLIWKGDRIIWVNFFRHYIFCLHHVVLNVLISDINKEFTKKDIPVFGSVEKLPTKKAKMVFSKISNIFFGNDKILKLIENIALRNTNADIRRDEVELYLGAIHLYGLKAVFDVFIEEGLTDKSNGISIDATESFSSYIDESYFEAMAQLNNDYEKILLVLSIQNNVRKELRLIDKVNSKERSLNKEFLFFDFPFLYVESLESICFPEWYTACFMSTCESSSVWGHYGSNHSGVCLIYGSESVDSKLTIKLKLINSISSSGEKYGWRDFEFEKINYDKNKREIDFFKSLGLLPTPIINSMWYYDEKRNRSSCGDEVLKSVDDWRKKYWFDFKKDIKLKSTDWSYENEYRLILFSNLIEYFDESKRVLNYDFSSLKGLVFGINCSDNDRVEIIKIIRKKCLDNKRERFKFYQAYFCFVDDCIKKYEMSLIKFEPLTPTPS